MGNRLRRGILFAVICILCMFPHKTSAAETEYDFNKKKAVTITDTESYAISGKYTWLKYTPKANGYLTVQIANPNGAVSNAKGYLSLFDSKKATALSSKSIFYNTEHEGNSYWYEVAFGLKKGQTYYIRVMGENGAKLSRTFTKLNDKAGTSRAKARNLNKNKARKGLIEAGSASADWYKIKLAKAQKLRLYYNVRSRGSFKISVYSGKQLIASRNIYYTSKQRKITLYLKTAAKKTGLVPGDYYVKIEQTDSASSGFYKLKWN